MLYRTLILLAISIGLFIAYLDSRPNWDDTGVTAVLVFLSCLLFATVYPNHPWVWALAIGLWFPFLAIIFNQNYGACLALVIATSGAYAGMFIRIRLVPIMNKKRDTW